MVNLTKQYKFCAAHRYWNEDWTEEKNLEIFGDDVRIHGHNYILSITLKGHINEESGFIIDLQKLNDIVNELSNNQPIQYILSEVEFYGIKLKVNKNVLIPRPETEELVDWLLKDDFQSVLDIGTGSGCIAIALALNSNAIINAIDISKHALMVAQKNSINNRVKINFQNQDILKLNKLPKYDIIVSNPPYVLESYKSKISKKILDFEPHNALFVSDNNPLLFYTKIAKLAIKSLNNNGKLYFEINQLFAAEIFDFMHELGFVDIELKKDINGKKRMIRGTKN